jgi:hypothetical protein
VAQAAALDHGRPGHADPRCLGGDPQVGAAEQCSIAGETITVIDCDAQRLALQTRPARKSRQVEPCDLRGDIRVARTAAAPLGVHHDWQALAPRDVDDAIEFLVVEKALGAGQHGVVVNHDRRLAGGGAELLGVDRGETGDHAVGGRVAAQVGQAVPLPLGGDGQLTVLDKGAGVAQIGEVLTSRAVPPGAASGHGLAALAVLGCPQQLVQFPGRSVVVHGWLLRRLSGPA